MRAIRGSKDLIALLSALFTWCVGSLLLSAQSPPIALGRTEHGVVEGSVDAATGVRVFRGIRLTSEVCYLCMTDIDLSSLDRELKKGAAELLLLSVLEARPRHGYELSKQIETQSGGRLVFHLDSLYPLLYRLEERGWIRGTWVEKAGERRRRFYRLTPTGRRVLARQRQTWDEFVEAVHLVTRRTHA